MINITKEKLEEFLAKLRARCEERGQTQINWGNQPFMGGLIVEVIIDGLKDSYVIYNLPTSGITFDRIWNGVL